MDLQPSVHEGERLLDYAVLATDVKYPLEAVGQLYRDRADRGGAGNLDDAISGNLHRQKIRSIYAEESNSFLLHDKGLQLLCSLLSQTPSAKTGVRKRCLIELFTINNCVRESAVRIAIRTPVFL